MAELSAARRGHFGDTKEANLPMSMRRICPRVDIGAVPQSHSSPGNVFFFGIFGNIFKFFTIRESLRVVFLQTWFLQQQILKTKAVLKIGGRMV